MAKKKQAGSEKSKPERHSPPWLAIGIVAATALVAAGAGAVYWFRGPIGDFFLSVTDAIISALGLGVVPVALWLAVFVITLALRRSWFRKYRLWLGSVALVVLMLGAMAFFQPSRGTLAAFTLYGDVSLGGYAGQAVIGSVTWLAALRLALVFVVGAFLVAPVLSSEAAAVLVRAVVFAYVILIVAVKGVANLLRSDKSAEEPEQTASTAYVQQAEADAFSPYRSASAFGDDGTGVAAAHFDFRPESPMPDVESNTQPAFLSPYARTSVFEGEGAGVAAAEFDLRVEPQMLDAGPNAQPDMVSPYASAFGDDGAGIEAGEFDLDADPDAPSEAPSPYASGSAFEDNGVETAEDNLDLGPEASISGDSVRPGSPADYGYSIVGSAEEAYATNGHDTPEADGYENGMSEEEYQETLSQQEDDLDAGVVVESAAANGLPERLFSSDDTKFNSLWGSFSTDASETPLNGGDELEHGFAPEARPMAMEWTLPTTDFLRELPEGGVTDKEMLGTGETIRHTLSEYGVEVEIGQIRPGPRVTMYGLIPGWVRRYRQVRETDEDGRPKLDEFGKPIVRREETKTRVKVGSILSREKDLALALKTPSIRIETPVMGKSLIGIEIPNPNPGAVSLRSVMESDAFKRIRESGHLPVALGKGSGGETMVIDLAKMPHLLVAGATGSGKSACLNGIISSLIMEKSPAELRLLLIDPKRVELTPYNGIPHLLTPVVVETDQVVGLLKGMIREMLDRYRRMEEAGVRNIEAYNERMPEKMPMLVVAIDELADLMMSAAFDVEQALCRLAQLGRATGIHLVVATQRPSVDVVTGLIKANFPSRISFGVTSQVDSRTILDTNGADKLLGRGDMLYLPLDASRPERVQGVFISDREVEHLVNFWQTTPWAYVRSISLKAVLDDEDGEGQDGMDGDTADEMLDKAVGMAQTHSKISTSLLQRRLRIGYPRAARLMDELEDRGIVGPSDGSRSRDVIMNST